MSKDKFIILGQEIEKGKGAILEIEIAKLHTRNTMNIPVIVERSKKPGPTILLLAGVHGDEVNGVAIVRELIKQKFHKPDFGVIICIPVFNVFGFLNLSREFPDGRDLNRVFPGTENGSLASQFAFKFTKEIAPLVDYVIDFHTGGADRVNVPQVRCNFNETKTFELAKYFDAPFILNSNYIPKSLRFTLNNMGKTTILFEGGKSREIDRNVVKVGVSGAINVMRKLGVLSGEINEVCNSVVIDESKWIRAPHSGLLNLRVKNGSWVKAKEILGNISDPFGEFERKIKASKDGYIFCTNTSAIVNKGDAIFHIGQEGISRK